MRRAGALLVAVFFGIALLLFVAQRYWIVLAEGERTYGTVTRVTSENTTCGRSRHRFRWSKRPRRGPCTWYSATVHYQVKGDYHVLSVAAGQARGHDQPVELAEYHRGSQVPIIYRRSAPDSALRDEPWDVWGIPLLTFLLVAGCLYGGLVRNPDA